MKNLMLTVALCLPLGASCASIMTGGEDTVKVLSNPPGAHFKTNTGESGTTPSSVTIPEDLVLEVEYSLAGYEFKKEILEPMTSAWILGNLLLGGPGLFIGIPIDIAGGGAKTHPKSIEVDLVSLSPSVSQRAAP